MTSRRDVTQLLEAVGQGSKQAVDDLLPLVYDTLRGIAANYMREERVNHTMQTTALVHEAYIRMVAQSTATWENRLHFFRVAAKAMRRILVDRARAHRADKRGGQAERVPLDQAVAAAEERAIDLLALDDSLERLAEFDERKCRVVELRFFGGMTFPEIAESLGCPLRTVERDWTTAKAWLRVDIDAG